jgi:hypothetical protein
VTSTRSRTLPRWLAPVGAEGDHRARAYGRSSARRVAGGTSGNAREPAGRRTACSPRAAVSAAAPSTLAMGLYAGGVWRSKRETTADVVGCETPRSTQARTGPFPSPRARDAGEPVRGRIWESGGQHEHEHLRQRRLQGGVGDVMNSNGQNPATFRFNGTSWGGVWARFPRPASPWNGTTRGGAASTARRSNGVALNISNPAVACYASFFAGGYGFYIKTVFRRPAGRRSSPPGRHEPQIRTVVTVAHQHPAVLLALPFDGQERVISSNSGARLHAHGVDLRMSASRAPALLLRRAEPVQRANQWIAGDPKQGALHGRAMAAATWDAHQHGVGLQPSSSHHRGRFRLRPEKGVPRPEPFERSKAATCFESNGGTTWVSRGPPRGARAR